MSMEKFKKIHQLPDIQHFHLKEKNVSMDYTQLIHWSGAPDRKISVWPDNWTGLIEAGYRPEDRSLASTLSDEGLFTELGNEDYEKRNRLLQQSGEKLFSLRHILMNFDSAIISFFRCTHFF